MEIAIERACSITTSRDYMLPAVIKSLLNKFLFTLYVSQTHHHHPPVPLSFLLVLLIEHNTVDIRCARITAAQIESQSAKFHLARYCACKSLSSNFYLSRFSHQIKWIPRHTRTWLEKFLFQSQFFHLHFNVKLISNLIIEETFFWLNFWIFWFVLSWSCARR